MHAQCGVAKLGGCLTEVGPYIFSVTVSNKRIPLLATQMRGEEIRLTRAFSIPSLHMPSSFATRIMYILEKKLNFTGDEIIMYNCM